ncbi:putative ankyrin repeat protein [Colletotrichum sublineola]|uniref:Putative ankyrin repeat protein n=1 Tax=Colletotrichum sublineola TaxID=1173701 RepID=A0A066X4I9_COLSU|nr:putative ankyrin repeat protein [Colletotrichum sublineola]
MPSGGPRHKKLGTLSDTRASLLDTWQHPSSGPNLCISFRERRCPCSMLRTGSNEGSGIGGKANRVYNVRMLDLLTKTLKLAAKAEPVKPASCTIDAQFLERQLPLVGATSHPVAAGRNASASSEPTGGASDRTASYYLPVLVSKPSAPARSRNRHERAESYHTMQSQPLIETVPRQRRGSSSESGTSSDVDLVESYNDNNSYTVGWVCTTNTDHLASRAFLENVYTERRSISKNDHFNCTFGSVGEHKVVIVCLRSGETVITNITDSTFCIGGVIDYDILSKPDGFEPKYIKYYGDIVPPVSLLQLAVEQLNNHHVFNGTCFDQSIRETIEKHPTLLDTYKRPESNKDQTVVGPQSNRLFQGSHANSSFSEATNRYTPPRRDPEKEPKVRYGTIASSSQPLKRSSIRDTIAQEKKRAVFRCGNRRQR